MRFLGLLCGVGALVASSVVGLAQERLPQQVAGTWRITRVLPVRPTACWTEKEVGPLVGSELRYGQTEMRWHGGAVALTGVSTRVVTAEEFAKENAGGEAALTLAELGIRSSRGVLEVDMQHDDADVTGWTTEVPGDSVLVAGPGRIVVSACGVYLEARRVPAGVGVETSSTVAGPGSRAVRKGL